MHTHIRVHVYACVVYMHLIIYESMCVGAHVYTYMCICVALVSVKLIRTIP